MTNALLPLKAQTIKVGFFSNFLETLKGFFAFIFQKQSLIVSELKVLAQGLVLF